MEALGEELPGELADSADWILKTKNGKAFRCHGLLLRMISPVLASAAELCSGDVCIHFPEYMDEYAAVVFFRWSYHLDLNFTPELAYGLAMLGHEWNIKGKFEALDPDEYACLRASKLLLNVQIMLYTSSTSSSPDCLLAHASYCLRLHRYLNR